MPRPEPAPDPAAVLTKALNRAAQSLGFSQRQIGRILGLSEASVSRLFRGRPLAPESKEGELALLFLRLFRSLDTLVGGREDQSRLWLAAPNHHLGGTPAELIESVSGLVHVVEYLDALRGRL